MANGSGGPGWGLPGEDGGYGDQRQGADPVPGDVGRGTGPAPGGTDDAIGLARRLRVEQDEQRRNTEAEVAERRARTRWGRRRAEAARKRSVRVVSDEAPPTGWQGWTRGVVRSRGFGRFLAIALILGALTVRATQVQDHNRHEADRMVAAGIFLDPSMSGTWDLTDLRPRPGVEESAVPIGQPPATTATGSHAFEALQSDGRTPVAYDPCRPVHYVVNPAGGLPDGDQLIAAAVAKVSAATGLTFVDDGHTDEVWVEDRATFQPERYADRWAPILISWSAPERVPELADTVAGMGGSARVDLTGGWVFLTGSIVLDGPQLADLEAGPGPPIVQATVQHELGHVVGLDHVDDESQLMNPVGSDDVTDYAAGDLEGLAALGRGRCFPEL